MIEKVKKLTKKQIAIISIIVLLFALLCVFAPKIINRITGNVYNVVENKYAGITITIPKKVLLGDPSGWEQYKGATIYNWENFEVTIDNSGNTNMDNIKVEVSGTGSLTGSNNDTSELYCNHNFSSNLPAGSSETFRCYGVVKDAYNYKDVKETMTIEYELNGEKFHTTSDIEFYHKVPEISLDNIPMYDSEQVEYEVWNNTNNTENFYVKISKKDVYMDISEDLWNQDIEYWYKSMYAVGQDKYAVHVWGPQTGSSARTVRGEQLYPRLSDYMQYTNYGTETDILSKERAAQWLNDHNDNNRLYGSPKSITNGTVRIHTPIYAEYRKQNFIGIWGKERDTYGDNFGSTEGDTGYSHGKMSDVGFNLTVYDKSALGRKINDVQYKLDKFDDDIYDKTAADTAINHALSVFTTRVLTQNDIDSEINALASYDNYTPPKKLANYQAFDDKLSEAKDIYDTENKTSVGNYELYKESTFENFKTVYIAEKDLRRNIEIDEQHLVDEALGRLAIAMNALELNQAHYDSIESSLSALSNIGIITDMETAITTPLEKVKVTIGGKEYEYYSNDSWNTLQEKVNAISTILDKKTDEQELIENVASEINAAVAALVVAPADYEELTAKIQTASELITQGNITSVGNHYLYTDNSWNNFLSKYSESISLSKDLNLDSQELINLVTSNLTISMTVGENGLVYNPGYYENVISALNSLSEYGINVTMDNLNPSNPTLNYLGEDYNIYTSSSFNSLQTALNNVDPTKLANEQEAIETMATNVLEAKNALVVNSKLLSAIENSITEYNKITKTWYEESYINQIENKITGYNSSDKNLKNQNIRQLVSELGTLISNIENHVLPANYDELNQQITVAEQISEYAYDGVHKLYTNASFSSLQSKISAAKALPTNLSIKEQKRINEAKEALINAMTVGENGLIYNNGDYSRIDTKLSEIETLDLSHRANVDALEQIMDYISEHRNLYMNEQKTIDQMYTNLNEAYENLGVDYTKLDEIINIYEQNIKPNSNLYEAAEYSDLVVAINSAKLISRDLKIGNQLTIDNVRTDIATKIALLKFKKADYSSLMTAIAKLPNDYSKYDKSLKKEIEDLYNDLETFDEDLLIVYQNVIDNMVNRIEKILSKISESPTPSDTAKDVASNKVIVINQPVNTNSGAKAAIRTKSSSNVNEKLRILKSVKINNISVDLNKTPYEVSVKSDVTKVKTEVELYNKKYTYEIFGGQKLAYGTNQVTIIVKDTSNKKYSYIIYIERKMPTNYLKQLKIKGININFDKLVKDYTIEIDQKMKHLDIVATPESKDAVVAIKDNMNLINGSKVIISVTSPDGSVRKYTLTIEKQESNIIPIIVLIVVVLSATIGVLRYLISMKKEQNQ